MSSYKIKSLKLQRNSQRNESANKLQLQDASMILAEETKTHMERIENSSKQQESLTPIHSTPKRSSSSKNVVEEQSTIEHRMSPIYLPCTQDGYSEVAWDWQSPMTKSTTRKCRRDAESACTPKRTTALQKKRSSNSPLLYKPLKRQLMKNDSQQESIEKFTAEMRALSEQIKTVPKDEQPAAARVGEEDTNGDVNDDDLLIQIDVSNFDCETKFESIVDEDSSSLRKVVAAAKTSLDDFFDDSIDDSMVKCSQEVEEKLKLESYGEKSSNGSSTNGNVVKDLSWHQQSYTRSLADKTSKDRSDNTAGSSSKLGSSTNSKNASIPSRAVTPSSETKKSSTASSATTTGTSSSTYSRNEPRSSSSATRSSSSSAAASSTGGKSNPLSARGSSFSLKAPTTETKSFNFSIKLPITEAKRTNALTATTSNLSNSSSFNNNDAKKTSKQSSDVVGSSLEEIFEIPDDSFDDFLAVGFDEVAVTGVTAASSKKDNGNPNKATNRFGKIHEASDSAASSGNLQRGDTFTRKVTLPPPTQASSNSNSSLFKGNTNGRRDANASSVFLRSVSNDSLTASSSSAVQQSQSTAGTSQARKFFKSKSHSTSSFEEKSGSNVASGASSTKGWKSNLFVNVNVASVSTQEKKIPQANQASQNNACPRTNGNEGNTRMYNVNRNAPREDDSIRYKRTNGYSKQEEGREVAATGSQAAQICTPEEIERKRLEAKMKLEARRKLMARSTSAGTLSGGTLQRPVKR